MQKQAITIYSIFLFTLAVTLYFALRLSLGIFSYVSLSETVPAKILAWEIETRGSRYGVKGDYEYKIKEKTYRSATRLSGPLFMNEEAAIDSVKKISSWVSHYNPSNPGESSLERAFPKGFAIRFFLCLLTLVYFWFAVIKKAGLNNFKTS